MSGKSGFIKAGKKRFPIKYIWAISTRDKLKELDDKGISWISGVELSIGDFKTMLEDFEVDDIDKLPPQLKDRLLNPLPNLLNSVTSENDEEGTVYLWMRQPVDGANIILYDLPKKN